MQADLGMAAPENEGEDPLELSLHRLTPRCRETLRKHLPTTESGSLRPAGCEPPMCLECRFLQPQNTFLLLMPED